MAGTCQEYSFIFASCHPLNDFQLNTDFPSQFCVFLNRKITQRYSKIGFSRKCKEENPSHFFFRRTRGSNNSFTLIENNFWFLKIAKLYGCMLLSSLGPHYCHYTYWLGSICSYPTLWPVYSKFNHV